MLDFASAMEVFRRAQREGDPASRACYKVLLITAGGKRISTDSGVELRASCTCEQAPPLDTLVIPGGMGIHSGSTVSSLIDWLAARSAFTRRIMAVRDGVYCLAAAGLLANRTVTTHWRYARNLAQRFPDTRVAFDSATIRDGPIFSCTSANAAMELAISLIEEDYGRRTALEVAKEFLSFLRPAGETRNGNFMAADYVTEPADRLSDIPAWVAANLRANLTIDNLAARACLCPRHFSRRFKEVFHCTPADFVELVRLAEAKKRLLSTRSSIESIALAVGFHSSDSFRRAFEKQAGVTPRDFRKGNTRKSRTHQPHAAFAVHAGGRR